MNGMQSLNCICITVHKITKSQFNKFNGMKLLNIVHFNQECTVTIGLLSVYIILNQPKRLTVDRLTVYLKLHV